MKKKAKKKQNVKKIEINKVYLCEISETDLINKIIKILLAKDSQWW